MLKKILSAKKIMLARLLSICMVSIACSTVAAETNSASALREKHAALEQQLQQNQFQQPLVIESTETAKGLKGDVYAVLDHPITAVRTGLSDPAHWCDVLILHINTKFCQATMGRSGTMLNVHIGKKTHEELNDAKGVEFNYRLAAATPEYMEVLLDARDGPMGTSDYRIQLEAAPLPNGKTFLHLTFSHSVNLSGRLAMQTYLATIGRGKVGFTVTGSSRDGHPEYIAGVRGLVERNTMRYYLAIDAYLDAANAAPSAQFEKRLHNWFTAAERYPRQLHEITLEDYLTMKRAEYARQQIVR
jgi:hypothetical protein